MIDFREMRSNTGDSLDYQLSDVDEAIARVARENMEAQRVAQNYRDALQAMRTRERVVEPNDAAI